MKGPGKYEDLCTLVRERNDAAAVVLVVLGGSTGNGFSVQTIEPTLALELPVMLRSSANQMEADLFKTEASNE